MLHHEAAVIDDIYADDRIPHDAYRPTFVRSLVMVPIRTADPIGAIGNYWATQRHPSDDEVQLLQALADSTAVAMQSARLYEQLESVHDHAHELTTANDQLRDFVYAVAHDVRSPLSTIQGFADLLCLTADDQPADAREALTAIRSAAHNLADYVSDLLAFATADGRQLQAEVLSLRHLVDDVTVRLAQPIRERGAVVQLDADDQIVADRVLIGQALQNLIGNAIAYSPQDRDPVVRVAARRNDSGWELTVSDNGLGVPEAERASIFEAFRRGSTGAGQPGTGLGLALCRRVAERHGGDIAVREGPAGGAEFVMQLVGTSSVG
jgi:signal transduction histidine kinase